MGVGCWCYINITRKLVALYYVPRCLASLSVYLSIHMPVYLPVCLFCLPFSRSTPVCMCERDYISTCLIPPRARTHTHTHTHKLGSTALPFIYWPIYLFIYLFIRYVFRIAWHYSIFGVMTYYDINSFRWTEREYSLKEIVEKYSSYLPFVVLVTEGYSSRHVEITADQVRTSTFYLVI